MVFVLIATNFLCLEDLLQGPLLYYLHYQLSILFEINKMNNEFAHLLVWSELVNCHKFYSVINFYTFLAAFVFKFDKTFKLLISSTIRISRVSLNEFLKDISYTLLTAYFLLSMNRSVFFISY